MQLFVIHKIKGIHGVLEILPSSFLATHLIQLDPHQSAHLKRVLLFQIPLVIFYFTQMVLMYIIKMESL